MKRSSEFLLYVSPSDFDLAMKGRKTATSRLGNRGDIWKPGMSIHMAENEGDREVNILVTYTKLTKLGKIDETQAGTIGAYGVDDHYADFVSIYPEADRDSKITVVGFYVL